MVIACAALFCKGCNGILYDEANDPQIVKEVYSNICMKIHISSKLTQYLINL